MVRDATGKLDASAPAFSPSWDHSQSHQRQQQQQEQQQQRLDHHGRGEGQDPGESSARPTGTDRGLTVSGAEDPTETRLQDVPRFSPAGEGGSDAANANVNRNGSARGRNGNFRGDVRGGTGGHRGGGRRRGESFGDASLSSSSSWTRNGDRRRGDDRRSAGSRRPRRLSEGSNGTSARDNGTQDSTLTNSRSGTGDEDDGEGLLEEEHAGRAQVGGHVRVRDHVDVDVGVHEGQGQPDVGRAAGSGSGKGKKKSDRGSGANANHLLNFQFQPVSGVQGSHGHNHHDHDGRPSGRKGNGSSKGCKGRYIKSGRGWGGDSELGPMSRDQFLQANFHFLLHDPTWTRGDGKSASPVYQEAFFDPDVLVDWDTVDTVRLFRKVSRHQKPVSRKESAPRTINSVGPSDHSDHTKTNASGNIQDNEDEDSKQRDKDNKSYTDEGKKDRVGVSWGSALVQPKVLKDATRTAKGISSADDQGGDGDDGDDGDGEWRCPICLQSPIAPRLTKCGHGPFCLVCILRHLRGEAYARCPLCFDNVHRDRLRRAICEEVVPFKSGRRASLLLLQRGRTSLAPRAIARGEPGGGDGVAGTKNDVLGAVGACPREGDDSERYSRLVTAKASTLRHLAVAEQASLQRFRLESIASGETEWVPFVSEAQASVSAQVQRFSAILADRVARDELSPSPGAGAGAGTLPRQPRQPLTPPAVLSLVEDQDQGQKRSEDEDRSTSGGGRDNGPRKGKRAPGEDADGRRGSNDHGGQVVESTGRDEALPKEEVTPAAAGGGRSGGGPFRFFQSLDGQRAFLHPLDMRQLLDDVDKGLPLPKRIDAQVLEVETIKLNPELRRRLPFLGHLPVHCDVTFLELDMAGFVSAETADKFHQETDKRERLRRARMAAEAKAVAKEAREEKARAARIAAMRAFTVDLQGPKPGDTQQLPSPSQATASMPSTQVNPSSTSTGEASNVLGSPPEDGTGAHESRGSMEESTRGEGSSDGAHGLLPASQTNPSEAAAEGSTSRGTGASAGDGAGGEARWSFARVTAMNGHFPSLPLTGTPPPKNASVRVSGTPLPKGKVAWGRNAAVETKDNSGARGLVSGVSNGGGGVRGSPKPDASSPRRVESAAPSRVAARDGEVGGDGDGALDGDDGGMVVPSSGNSGKKRGRKAKAVPLFSNAGVRGVGR